MADLEYSDRKTTEWLEDYNKHIVNMLDMLSIPQATSAKRISISRFEQLTESDKILTGSVGEKLWNSMNVQERWFYIIGKFDGEND